MIEWAARTYESVAYWVSHFSFLVLIPDGLGALGGLQQEPSARDVLLLEASDDAVGNLFKVARGQGENGGSSAREADTQQTRLRLGRH